MFQRMLVKRMYKTNPLSQAADPKFGLRMAAWMGGRYESTMALQSVRLECAMAAPLMEAVERGTRAQQYVIHKRQAAPQIRKPWGLNG